jgi:carboxyl-terminal processing protease
MLSVGFALGVATAMAAMPSLGLAPSEARAAAKFGRESFLRALDTVLDRYVDPVEPSELLARGLKHIVNGLDAHSHYLSASERRAIRKRARGGTTGLTVELRRDEASGRRWLEVVAVAPDSPAAKANIQPGDHVLSIRGHDVALMHSQIEAEGLLLGSVGEAIALSVQRKREVAPVPVALTLSRDRGKVVHGQLLRRGSSSVAHVRIRAFRRGTGERTKRALASLRRAAGSAGLAGIVLDLRGNAGGEVNEALVVADLFVDTGVLMRTRGRGGRVLREERAHTAGSDTATPLAVLQDRHSASASELLAAALQENGRATVVGERSYGKGTVQDVIGMEDGSVLTLTIARYFSPKDHVIDGVGVSPDRHVALPPSTSSAAGRDSGLEEAVREVEARRSTAG